MCQVPFEVVDLFKTRVPKGLVDLADLLYTGDVFGKDIFRVHPGNEYIFVMCPVKHSELPLGRQSNIVSPYVIMGPLEVGRDLKTMYLHPIYVAVFKNFAYEAVLA